MNELQKNYYAIIPANVRYDEKIRPNAKLLYGEITALCNEKGYCWASNQYFAKLYSVSKKSISTWINELVERGYITNELIYKEGTKEILHRYIRIVQHPSEENFRTPMEEKVKDNNTSFNNTFNNTLDIKNTVEQRSDLIPFKEIIDYLNQRAGKNFKYAAAGNKKVIKARWNEGYRLTDFKQVIDEKCEEWLNNDKMSQYIQPSTLFGNKFDQYLNQQSQKKGNGIYGQTFRKTAEDEERAKRLLGDAETSQEYMEQLI